MSDEKFNQLELQLSRHIDFCHQQFEELRESLQSNAKCVGELIDAQKQSTRAITDLAKATEGVVEVYNNVNGAVKVGVMVQKFGLWLIKWGVLGVAFYTFCKTLGTWIDKGVP